MKLAAILAPLLLAACATHAAPEPDAIPVVWHKTPVERIGTYCRLTSHHSVNWDAQISPTACSTIVGNVCHIYAVDDRRLMASLGHELKHCFDGDFHYHDAGETWK